MNGKKSFVGFVLFVVIFSSTFAATKNKDLKKLITFPGNKEGSYTVPNSVEVIGFGAFENTKLEEVLKKAGVVDAGGYGFVLILKGMLSVFKDGVMIELAATPVVAEAEESTTSVRNAAGELEDFDINFPCFRYNDFIFSRFIVEIHFFAVKSNFFIYLDLFLLISDDGTSVKKGQAHCYKHKNSCSDPLE